MTREESIKWAPEIKAIQQGKTIQKKYFGMWMDAPTPLFVLDNEYRIKPESVKRLPTIDEVKEWFMENRVFIFKLSQCYGRIFTFTEKPCDHSEQYIFIAENWCTIEEFCKKFTHADGTSLYITEN